MAGNRYLEGWYAPVAEETTAADLAVDGTIPEGLAGRYLRNGPNPWPITEPNGHWFLGHGMLHGVEIGGGAARWYRSRYVRTARLAAERGEPDRGGPADVNPGNPANTHVIGHAGRILALCEAGLPYEVTPELETVGRVDFAPAGATGLRGPMIAHPKTDPVSGDLLFIGYQPFPPYMTYHLVDGGGRLVRSEAITLPEAVMAHDIAITDRHVLLFDLPAVLDYSRFPSSFYRWNVDHQARIGVMPRDGGDADVQWFDVDPCYVFHTMNACVTPDGAVTVDAVRYESVGGGSGPFDDSPPALHRWTLDLPSGAVKEEQLDDRPIEFPRVNEDGLGRRRRFGYGTAMSRNGGGAADPAGLVKYDLDRGTSAAKGFGDGKGAGEFVHVTDGGAEEDSGWLIGFVHDRACRPTDLVILDAGSLETAAVVHLPVHVPFGFHGSFIADGDRG